RQWPRFGRAVWTAMASTLGARTGDRAGRDLHPPRRSSHRRRRAGFCGHGGKGAVSGRAYDHGRYAGAGPGHHVEPLAAVERSPFGRLDDSSRPDRRMGDSQSMSDAGRVVVTGATGFVGSAIVRAFLAAGYPVRALVRAASPRSNLAGLE